MLIFSFNVNGLRAIHRKNLFLPFLKKYHPDILCLQETKAHENDLPFDLKLIDGYNSYFNDAEKKGYSGTAIYTKIKPEKIITNFPYEILTKEGRVLQANFKDFILLNVYFPNGKASPERLDYKMNFYDKFLLYLKDLEKITQNIIFCGDVNTAHKPIDLTHPKANETTSGFLPIERAWIDKLIQNNYFDTFRLFNDKSQQYTWWSMRSGARTRNVGWRIDYFFAHQNLKDKITNAQIHPEILGSDHCPINIEFNP